MNCTQPTLFATVSDVILKEENLNILVIVYILKSDQNTPWVG